MLVLALKIFFMAVQYWHGQINVAKWPVLIASDNIYLSPKMEPIGPILNQGLSSFIFTQRFIMYFSSQQLEWVMVWPSLIIVGEDYIAWDDVAKIALQKKLHLNSNLTLLDLILAMKLWLDFQRYFLLVPLPNGRGVAKFLPLHSYPQYTPFLIWMYDCID